MLEIALIKSRIAARAGEFLRDLFGERLHRAGRDWRVGNKGSLALDIENGELVFFDHEAGQGGDCIALWARERGCDNGDALKACAAWAGVADDGTHGAPPPKSAPAPVDRDARLATRPPRWPMLDGTHDALWRSGIDRLLHDAEARAELGRWRGWEPGTLIPLARAGLISAPAFALWPAVIDPQPCVCFRVLHPDLVKDGTAEFWAWRPVQLHIRFRPGATRRDGSPLSWIYAPTMKRLGIGDGGNAPFIIARDGRDPEQPGYGTRGDFAERVHTGCCDFIYDVNHVSEPEPSPEALQKLGESRAFQALFQFRFAEAVNRGRSPAFDISFPNPVRFTFAPPVLRHVRGHFTGEVDLLDAGAGETSGSFRFELPRAIDSGPPEAVLDGAILYLKIYRFPTIRDAPAA